MAALATGRYARIAETPWVGQDGLDKLQRSTVAVIGVGNVGGQLAQHFALIGSNLVLVDSDTVGRENLGTQGFSETEDVGIPKVEARARLLESLNRGCDIKAVHRDVAALGLGALRDADVIIACVDNRRSRVVINEVATRLGTPWVDTGLDGTGTMMFGRVATYDTLCETSACYICQHDGESLLDIASEGAPQGCPVPGEAAEFVAPATLAISALGGIVAASGAVAALKLLLGRGSVSCESTIDLDNMKLTAFSLQRNPDCVSDHRALTLTPLEGVETVRDTFAIAAKELGAGTSLQFRRRNVDVHDTDRLTGDDVERFGRRTWTDLGVPPEDVIVASNGSVEIAYLLP